LVQDYENFQKTVHEQVEPSGELRSLSWRLLSKVVSSVWTRMELWDTFSRREVWWVFFGSTGA
jgi:hypothetical protein